MAEEQEKEIRGDSFQKKQFVKKNYIDPTAGFFYILGCSLVHFSLIIGGMFVLYPDISKAKELDAAFVKL